MIRAHLATFPPRKALMLETLHTISPQVDQIFLVLNEYASIPEEVTEYDNVEAIIPSGNLKDAGKFYFEAEQDDIIFTIDDDIFYPQDYVHTTLSYGEKIDLTTNVIGYQGNAWVHKKKLKAKGWRNFMFFNKCNNITGLDVIGTGTACFLGKNAPPFTFIESSAGFVDLRFSLYQRKKGNLLWSLPRDDEYLALNLPEHLHASSIFNTVTRKGSPQIANETRQLILSSQANSGIKYDAWIGSKTNSQK